MRKNLTSFSGCYRKIAQARKTMQLFIRGTQTHVVQVNGAETVEDVKALIADKEGYSVEDQVILYGGKPLDSGLLANLCEDLTTLEVNIKMLGGKVHGSLARAGKVKGQTPKVDKQEKKKKKTGRAKRRMQYNRRYVNVVQGFGRRKGPNANS
ncbi:ubiquitin-like FUBI-ribosomal protein eS30 fusion protein isoform X1 [Ruditapes philippinarum]|uniref:ubiquitin-like FUBI-ribosomal protein eS30 fusion protein isoform X1 n=1 Tax=Ruditapes philippinarum TaxID=129788 RepID=UPI00295B2EA2|nr:ubiquitin-like FUBI-ribosomal protein eS30 fusion protein isoform X1 [Ruditapes philippinarum]